MLSFIYLTKLVEEYLLRSFRWCNVAHWCDFEYRI